MAVADRIKQILEEKGMSKRQLAIKANIPTSSLQAAMTRGKNMTVEMLKAIANALDVPIEYLLEISDLTTKDSNLRLICDYTGLSVEAVEHLHLFKHKLACRLVEQLAQNEETIKEIDRLLSNSAYAYAESKHSSEPVDKKNKSNLRFRNARITELERELEHEKTHKKYMISAEDAADLYFLQVQNLLSPMLSDILKKLRSDRVLLLSETMETFARVNIEDG